MAYDGFSLEGRVAIITGGSSGIGRSLALGFAQAGARVSPFARRAENVNATVDEIRALGAESLPLVGDALSASDLAAAVNGAVEKWGRLDIWVNCAGATHRAPSLDVTEEEWDRVIDINLKGTFLACQAAGRRMVAQGAGAIINIASLAAYGALPEVTAYCASKAAVAMVTKSLGCEWATLGVRVNAIAPGVFRTPLNTKLLDDPERSARILSRTPMGRYGSLDELQGAAIYLASDAARFVTGEILCVDGGFLAKGF